MPSVYNQKKDTWVMGASPATQALPESVIKRLEILKNYLILEDVSGVLHVCHALEVYAHRSDIAALMTALQAEHWGEALIAIDVLLHKHAMQMRHQDGMVRAQIPKLERVLQVCESEKNALERKLGAFQRVHTQILGWYILRMLQLKAYLVKDDASAHAKAEALICRYQAQVTAYHPDTHRMFRQAYQTARQACRHSSDSHLAFMALDHAYDAGDLHQVRDILDALKDGSFRPRLQSKDNVAWVAALSHEIKRIQADIARIKSSAAYQRAVAITDIVAYCERVKLDLIDEIDRLEQQLDMA